MWEPVKTTPPPGWETFILADYGFQFHYPAGWQVEALPDDHHLRLLKGSLALTVGFRRLEEDVSIMRTGVPAGDLDEWGGIEFLGGGVSRDLLVYQGKTKAVLYNMGREMEQSNGLVFTLSLDDQAQEPYAAVDIPVGAQLQVDWVVRTFQWLPQTEPTPAYPTPTPWPVAGPLQVRLAPYAQIGRGAVGAIEWLEEGRTLAVGTSLGVRLIDMESGQEKTFIQTDRAVWRMKASPDGRTLAITLLGGGDTITPPSLWDLQTGELLAELPTDLSVETGLDSIAMGGMAFSPDGEMLGTLDMEAMRVWAARTGQLLHKFPRTGGVLAFSPDGAELLTNDGVALVVWDLATETELQRFPTGAGEIQFLSLSPDGRTVAVLGRDVRLIDAQDGRELAVLEESQGLWGEIVFSADGLYVAVGGNVWEAGSGRMERSLSVGDGYQAPLFSPDLRLAAALPLLRDPEAVYLWDGASGESLGTVFESRIIGSFAFSPDRSLLALVNLSRRIELWEIGSQRFVDRDFAPASTELGSLVFSPDGRLLAASDGNDILLWEAMTGGQPRRLQGHTEPVDTLVFARDGLTLFSGGRDNRLLQWDVKTGQPVLSLDGLRTDVVALAVSPDGELLVSGSTSVEYDQQGENPAYERQPIRVWDAKTGEYLRGFDYADVVSLEFGPDGSWIAAQLTVEPGLIDVKTGYPILSIPESGPFMTNLSVHPNGRLLATGLGRDVQLWDAAARQAVLTLKGDQSQVNRVAFSPDGRFLATTGSDGLLRLWQVEIP
jgi:WD40 repeat protein